jgi:hypothetical protein
MRERANRCAEIVCLDAQKQQMNELNWGYIGPVVKDPEFKVGVIAECLCIEESLASYAFVMKATDEMEQGFDLSKIKIIFADQFITETLLDELGIADTCIIHSDLCHLKKEVWPKYFGPHVYNAESSHLVAMFLLQTREEFETAYSKAFKAVSGNPDHKDYVSKIYNNPNYYRDYVLAGIHGNLKLNGDVAAEYNHSSVVAHLGKGGSFSLKNNLSMLFKCQQDLKRNCTHIANQQHLVAQHHQSNKQGQRKLDDELAKKSLSKYAYEKLFLRAHSALKKQQVVTNPDGSHIVFKIGFTATSTNAVQVEKDCRCTCELATAYDFQCSHKLALDGEFLLEKYHLHWYSPMAFRQSAVGMVFYSRHPSGGGALESRGNNTSDTRADDEDDNGTLLMILDNADDDNSVQSHPDASDLVIWVYHSDMTNRFKPIADFVSTNQKY